MSLISLIIRHSRLGWVLHWTSILYLSFSCPFYFRVWTAVVIIIESTIFMANLCVINILVTHFKFSHRSRIKAIILLNSFLSLAESSTLSAPSSLPPPLYSFFFCITYRRCWGICFKLGFYFLLDRPLAALAKQNRSIRLNFWLLSYLLCIFVAISLLLGFKSTRSQFSWKYQSKSYLNSLTTESSKLQNTMSLPLISRLFESIKLLTIFPIMIDTLLAGKPKIPV